MQSSKRAPPLTPLQANIAREIVSLARRENRVAGQHLPEAALAERIGTSRTPVKAALRHLQRLGVVAHDRHRGFFLRQNATELDSVARRFSAAPDDPLYLRLAADRQAGRLPAEATESALMRHFDVPRAALVRVLARAQKEGWVERNVGHGWRFVPMIDSADAYEESYLFRQTIEPAGLLGPSFRADAGELRELRRQQEFIRDRGFGTMTPIELFESNAAFHEKLAEWSGNRFILQSLQRVNQLRRLVEYRQADERTFRRTMSDDHLAILEAIERQDMLAAAALLREHLDSARKTKNRDPKAVFPPRTGGNT